MSEHRHRARDRQEQRRQRKQAMVRRMGTSQIKSSDSREMPSLTLPTWWRAVAFVPLSLAVVVGVVVLLGILNPPEVVSAPNAIWLNERWTHQSREDIDFVQLGAQLEANQIGTIYAYVSSLRANNMWSGKPSRQNIFNEVSENVRDFLGRWRSVAPDTEVFAWVEVLTSTSEGYRLDDENVQRTVAEFTRMMIEDFGFDGILLDVKPIFDGNADFLQLVRRVRASIGLNTPLGIAMPPDFTPTDAGIVVPDIIAPGTVFSDEYKQRVALQADLLVITAYNSYLSNPVDYIEWVRYQVEAFTTTIQQIDSGAEILISVPNYADIPPAHIANIESLAGGLDGVGRGYRSLDAEGASLIRGVAIFTDRDLSDNDWSIFREKWLSLR